MNYIKQLQEKNKSLQSQIDSAQTEINDFISFLHSDKFAGVDSAGERKDWISTADVLHKLMEIRSLL